MTAEQLFSICSTAVLPGWLLLLLVPRWRWTPRISGLILPLLLAVVYLVLIVTHFRGGAGGGFGSLVAVHKLFEDPYMLLAGWVHYLAFDLFIGAWEARDALQKHIPLGAVWPCLLLTFLFGPIGLLSYLVIRAAVRHRLEAIT